MGLNCKSGKARVGPLTKSKNRRCSRKTCKLGERTKLHRCPRAPVLCPPAGSLPQLQNVRHVRRAIRGEYGTRRSNALVATRAVPKNHLLFCEPLRLLHSTEEIEQYEDAIATRYGDKYEFPVVMRTRTSGFALVSLDPLRKDPRSLFYMMNHGLTAKARSVKQFNGVPFVFDVRAFTERQRSTLIGVCAKSNLAAGDELTWNYFSSAKVESKHVLKTANGLKWKK